MTNSFSKSVSISKESLPDKKFDDKTYKGFQINKRANGIKIWVASDGSILEMFSPISVPLLFGRPHFQYLLHFRHGHIQEVRGDSFIKSITTVSFHLSNYDWNKFSTLLNFNFNFFQLPASAAQSLFAKTCLNRRIHCQLCWHFFFLC